MPGRLDNKVAIITGAANGQGRVAAEVFAREGARLLLTDMEVARLDAVAEAAGGSGAEVATFVADLTQEEANRSSWTGP